MGLEKRRFNIEVTEKDIAKAKRNDSYVCVVSQAIARAIPDATRIETDTQAIRFSRNGERLVYMTPYAVQGYVIAFDAGDEIHPFSFQLREPARVKKARRTAAGLAAVRAARAADQAVRKSAPRGKALPEVHADARTAAKVAYAQARALHAQAKDREETTTGARKAPPRVFKKKSRTYGHRLLRINQQAAAT